MRWLMIITVLSFVPPPSCWAQAAAEGRSALRESIRQRIVSRTYPSVFQAWSPADTARSSDPLAVVARHDLLWQGVGWYGLRWDVDPEGLGETLIPQSVEKARALRETLLKLNPNLILLAEIRYRDAYQSFLPKDHEWWAKDQDGHLVGGWEEGGFICLDFANPQFRRHVAQQARAVVESGVVDGILLDWWVDDEPRLALVREVREALGDGHLLLANANDRRTPLTAPYLNGYFMECTASRSPQDWRRIESTLVWAEKNLRQPPVNCLETWYHDSRQDLNLMRAVTTLTLTHSNGYCLFSDPNPLPTPDHRHDWYPFWDKSLGTAVSERTQRPDGAVSREFEHGTVVYNPLGNGEISVVFPEARRSVATGRLERRHQVKAPDGDIFLKPTHESAGGRRGQ